MNNSKHIKVVCFGETLWDVFPDKKVIGGAPLNVALRLYSLGIDSSIISKVGDDHNGKKILEYLGREGLTTTTIQRDNSHATGVVQVSLNKKGSASYEIRHPAAWDKIELTDLAIDQVRRSDAFVFGSLAARDEVSRDTLLKLLDHASMKIFDVNLRPPHYATEMLYELMRKADFIKLNDEELEELSNPLLKNASSFQEMMLTLADFSDTSKICVTLGAKGALLLDDGVFYRSEGYPIKVLDTVGAGDSFLASLIAKMLTEEDQLEALNFACAVGALVASKSGANPKISKNEIVEFLR